MSDRSCPNPHEVSSGHSCEGHSHHHSIGHGHSHELPSSLGKLFQLGILIQLLFICSELVIGTFAHSIAVMADAAHNASDVLALLLSWGAIKLSEKKRRKGRTYGFRSATIFVSLINTMTLVCMNGAIAWECVHRFFHPITVASLPVIGISIVGVFVNGFCAWLFVKESKHDLNVKATFLHLASDALVAFTVACSGIAIYFTRIDRIDPIASFVIALFVMASSAHVLKQSLNLAMHATPTSLDEEQILHFILHHEDVLSVNDLHLWAISTRETAMTAHIQVAKLNEKKASEISHALKKKFPIHHVTLQIELDHEHCDECRESYID